jgi:hypothetical protein
MRRLTFAVLGAVALGGLGLPAAARAQQSIALPKSAADGHDSPEKKFAKFEDLVKGAKEYEGLFKLYLKGEHLYAEILPHQFDTPLLCPIAIARGMAMGGYTLNFDEQWVLLFRRVPDKQHGDKVHLVRRNVRFQAKKGSPVDKAVETTYTDSVLMAVPIKSINPMRQGVILDLNDVFMTDFAQLGLGAFDKERSTWHKVKAFPRNIEIEVAATYSGGSFGFFGDDSVIDGRGTTVVLHYGLVQLPHDGYQPRLADDRVGYFLSAVKDFTSDSRDTSFLRYVNRWRLERADTDSKNKNKLSPPKKKIVFWIENSVPDEYRAYVREGILEWNKAFEKVGFRDAIEVRQQEGEEFDPEDINYNTFRWIATDQGFAMGPSRANPLTGEILDADIIFDASMVRYYKQAFQMFRTGAGVTLEPPASLIRATRMGWTLPNPKLLPGAANRGWNDRAAQQKLDPARQRLWAVQHGLCQCGAHKSMELGLGALALTARNGKASDKEIDEMIGQAIKEVTMHEVGHTLGLRHNFKASTMLKNEELHDPSITRKKGLVGSVMDYNPVNLAPKGVKQGDYFTSTIGPYDYWAIEYAYKPLSGGTEGELDELKKIAARGAAPGHDYGTDEDLSTADPLINLWDLGNDPMKFGQERMLLAQELLKQLAEHVVEKGQGYQRARQAFTLLLRQYGDAAFLISSHVGGESIHRDHRGDPHGRDPFIPVKAERQREALKLVRENILTDKPFQFPPQLLRRLAADRWMHWGNEYAFYSSVDFPIHERILNIQRIVLDQVYDPAVLARIQNNALKADKDERPLTVAEVFRGMTESIWQNVVTDSKADGDNRPAVSSSLILRNLQREHLKRLSTLLLGNRSRSDGAFIIFFSRPASVPPDARSLARMHLREIQRRIEGTLKAKANLDDTTRAHLEECGERIAKVLSATMQVNE